MTLNGITLFSEKHMGGQEIPKRARYSALVAFSR